MRQQLDINIGPSMFIVDSGPRHVGGPTLKKITNRHYTEDKIFCLPVPDIALHGKHFNH